MAARLSDVAGDAVKRTKARRIVLIGSYVPRRCGIATFTTGLAEALAGAAPRDRVMVVAMNDRPARYDYPPRVVLEIDADRRDEYLLAANVINTGGHDLVCLQHEYGIYGGLAGSHLLGFLEHVRVPVVVTFHTVLGRPSVDQKRVLSEIADRADRLVVMNPRSLDLLIKVYGARRERAQLIPHGIPDVPLVDTGPYKGAIGAEGRQVLLTFGLISPGKGIEYMIQAMPAIVRRHPDALYIVLGGTHPHVIRESGESYRARLQRLVRELKVEGHVRFQNEFVGLPRLLEYLRAADLYVTPYLNMDQAVSGTLVYALGAGCAIVSTAYSHAEVVLAEGRGRLVPPRNADALARECTALLSDDAERRAVQRRAYEYSRQMIWPTVARQYHALFEDVLEARRRQPEPLVWAHSPEGRPLGLEEAALVPVHPILHHLPPVNFDHIRVLTDGAGILQHARYSVGDRRHGYATDDNARALIAVTVGRYVAPDDASLTDLAARYLGFLDHAFNDETGRFRNFMTYERRWVESAGSEDSHGRALWALGTAVALEQQEGHRLLAAEVFRRALPAQAQARSPRALAFAVLGLKPYLDWFAGDQPARDLFATKALELQERFEQQADAQWHWCEDTLTYVNAKLPNALITAGRALGRDAMVQVGLKALDWLVRVQCDEYDCFSPVGNHGWYPRGGTKARFDQQPIEANAMVEACLAAYDVTREDRWFKAAARAFEWFLGRNDMLFPLYDASTGGCRDGLTASGMNQNQGAESTLAWVLSLLRMHLMRKTFAGASEVDALGEAERRRPAPAAAAAPAANPGPMEPR